MIDPDSWFAGADEYEKQQQLKKEQKAQRHSKPKLLVKRSRLKTGCILITPHAWQHKHR